MTATLIMTFVGGYEVFLPGNWDIPTFLFSYTMVAVFPVLYFGWKVIHRTRVRRPEEVDLVTGLEEIEEYTRNYVPVVPRLVFFLSLSHMHTHTLSLPPFCYFTRGKS